MSNAADSEHANAGTTGPLDPETIRNRKREKQLRYQRHKARLGREASPSPSRAVDLTVDTSDGPAVTALPSPPRSKALSSPYIQSRLSTPPRKKEETVEAKPTSFPKRQPAGTRKSGLVQQMRAKQLAVTSVSHVAEVTDAQIEPHEDGTHVHEPEESSGQESEYNHDIVPETTVETETAVDECHTTQNEGAFDMRSILDHIPTPPPEPEAPNNTDDDDVNLDHMETTTDVAVFNPMDDEFVRRLRRIEESQQEEKKERDDDAQPSIDATWDVSNPLFQQQFASTSNAPNADTRKSSTDAVDMFATASWEQADGDASFSGVEYHFLRLMESTYSADIMANFSFEHQQVLEDVKRNLELASGIEKINLEIATNPTAFDKRLDAVMEDEPLVLDASATDSYVSKSEYPSVASLLGIVSRSEDTSTIHARVKEDEPLLLGISSSDGDDLAMEPILSLQERVDSYNAPKIQDEESIAEEDDATESDIENDEIGYVSQGSDEEDQTVDILNQLDDGMAKYLVTGAPTFDPAAILATQTAQHPIRYVSDANETREPNDEDLVGAGQDAAFGVASSAPQLTAEQRFAALASPPPPPPPRAKKNKKRGKTKFQEGTKLPLLAPPPEEKMKKWEEEKMRGKLYSTSFNASLGRSEAAETSSESIDEKFLLAWLAREVLKNPNVQIDDQSNVALVIRIILDDDDSFNKLCHFMAETVNEATTILGDDASFDEVTLTTTFSDDDTVTTADYSVRSHRSIRSRKALEKQRPLLKPMVLTHESKKLASYLLAANFVSFIYLTSKVSKIPSPFGNSNPFLADIVNSSLRLSKTDMDGKASWTPQKIIFDHPQGEATKILRFAYYVCKKSMNDMKSVGGHLGNIVPLKLDTTEAIQEEPDDAVHDNMASSQLSPDTQKYSPAISPPSHDAVKYSPAVSPPSLDVDEFLPATSPPTIAQPSPNADKLSLALGRRYIVPSGHPCPFEAALWEAPRIIPAILSFLGDPVVVCRMKMVNRYCNRLVTENEHTIIQDAVRSGGINMNVRPAFWMWISLQKCSAEEASAAKRIQSPEDLKQLEQEGREGKWQSVIERDVERSFGNMPPHKTGARLRTDSIVKALVTWGQSRVMKRGVKGGGEETPLPELGQTRKTTKTTRHPRKTVSLPPWECGPNCSVDDSDSSAAPADTVSDWGPISPVASMTENSYMGSPEDVTREYDSIPKEELALCGSHLTPDMKQDLQKKLRFILHSLAAAHGDVGYCQGMDYVVAHLLRILQDTIRWNAVQNSLPSCLVTASGLPDFSKTRDEPLGKLYKEVDANLVVEEAIFRIMDTLFTSYNLRHMYWPELRCLKTCCRVFERLIQIKLPVLADHFEHHELNVGLFALGWFQTLFLYLPGMPSETANRLIDIWLIERSFKIFFRVGAAILFLSQPILLNHELEGMMTYLNTIPDATLLKPDILIPCALNIKVTNRMLQQLEAEVTASPAEAST